MTEVKDILKKHSFRVTQHRCDVLTFFMLCKTAITHSDLEQKYRGEIDRVSLYRMLNSFTVKGILCKLIGSNGAVSYVFDKHFDHDKIHVHPHYKCKNCNDVIELPELPDSYMKLLERLKIDEINILAEGICADCEKPEKI